MSVKGDLVDALFNAQQFTRQAIELARKAERGDILVELQNARLCLEKAVIASADGLTFADLVEPEWRPGDRSHS